MIKYTLKIPDNQYYKNIFDFMSTFSQCKKQQKTTKNNIKVMLTAKLVMLNQRFFCIKSTQVNNKEQEE